MVTEHSALGGPAEVAHLGLFQWRSLALVCSGRGHLLEPAPAEVPISVLLQRSLAWD